MCIRDSINTDSDAFNWLNANMRVPLNCPLFDWRYFDQYDMSEGMELFIEGFHNAPVKFPLVTICSFNPPGGYYCQSPKSFQDIFFYSKVDFVSPQKSMRYEDELNILRGINPHESWQLILDVKTVSTTNGIQLEDCGWSVLPLFDKSHGGVYVHTGVFMVNFALIVAAGVQATSAEAINWTGWSYNQRSRRFPLLEQPGKKGPRSKICRKYEHYCIHKGFPICRMCFVEWIDVDEGVL
eukprot:TRINITY_DN15225_c0_g1_i4.p1 TRINITY_DN15225_c0_g1~~TRINITY_DN15225_c0_g1_i4.p1  ORF type:complete len:239 (+),score=2.35 TRINITY_DN15225_c0_g1_i4:68-784(+)